MRITEVSYEHSLPIKGYGVGFFRIGPDIKWGNLFIFNKEIHAWSGFKNVSLIPNFKIFRQYFLMLFIKINTDLIIYYILSISP